MMQTLVVRLRQLLDGFTRVTFTGCAGDPGVWERSAMERARERRRQPPPSATEPRSPRVPHLAPEADRR